MFLCVSEPILRQKNAYWVGAGMQRREQTAYLKHNQQSKDGGLEGDGDFT